MSKIITLKDGRQVDKCLNCRRDWDEVKHSSRGLCRGCARMEQHKENKQPQKWSKEFDCCQNPNCPNTQNNVTTQPHNADGLCRGCYSTKQRYVDLQHSHDLEATRRAQPGYKEKQAAFYSDWYERNKEEHHERTQEYRHENPEKARGWSAQYRESNRDKCRESGRKHWEANKEQEHQKRREWRQNNPDIVRQGNRRRRARLAGIEGDFTLEEWNRCLAEHNFECYHCHCKFTPDNIPTPDHLVPVVEGGSNFITNIAPLCGRCNSSKCGKPLQQFDPQYFRKRFGNIPGQP